MSRLLTRDDLAGIAVRSMEIMIDGDLGDFRAVVHPQAVNREAKDEPPASRAGGPAGFYATAQWLRGAFGSISFPIERTVVEGDLVVTYGTMTGRHVGEFTVWNENAQIERVFVPTGRPFEVNHAHFLRVADGQVIEHWAVRDDNSLSLQLGWVPPSPMFLFRCARAAARARRALARADG